MTKENTFDLEALFESFLEKLHEHPSNGHGYAIDHARIRSAFETARDAHEGQLRKDGTPYVTHAIAAAEIAAEMGLDEDSIVAALLHDCIEDTGLTYHDIAKKFGGNVADIVEGVTKLTRVHYTSKEEEQMENMRKMLMAMSKDIRVILIKIADRLHNMRTMSFQTPEKQRTKSLETMEIYAPIAHRLGMQKVKWELEDLSLYYLDPVGYHEITVMLENRKLQMDKLIKTVEEKIKARLDEWGIKAVVYGRVKHIYSIYRKMYSQSKDLQEIFDLCAFRVIVETIPDCYNVLGHIHDMFSPIPGRFKDYIGTPKPNMYQSVHTTVIGTEGLPFEVQIRTWEMHHTAEYGVAAHWKYKTGGAGSKSGDEERFAWVRRLVELQQDSDASDFFSELKIDMFADQVFVFTPQGDVINLSAGATPIDFAYSIHSAVGNSMIGAKVNGRIVPLSHALENGDIVEVMTSKNAAGPSRDWLKIAKSGSVRSKIKQWFKKERREENIIHGKEMFESEMKRKKLPLNALQNEELLTQILKKLAITSLDDMYASIGYGGMTAIRAVNRIRDEISKTAKTAPKTALDRLNELNEKHQNEPEKIRSVQGVLVEGLDNCLVKFARCCTPVPGDDIIGFITQGFGISIHRTDCPQYINNRINPENAGRWLNVSWAGDKNEYYTATLKIMSKEQSGLVMEIATTLNSLSAKFKSLTARDISGGKSTATITLEVADIDELNRIIARLAAIKGVTDIQRSN
ncbi:bifunctional (p)ppGpp synthetase/guanosine-3',5'-bis(diphosphate) 3'-pyrophosphohydrolase [Clostridiaceae bacterium OttesenSCG-928-D20]|nr:bifunctional (p)ppGpp synthetase/guanosine-3',5'-bis(diphosphate) 3'-pyrophosphohydrolase [Clostridiaceae bacterium OttesenSCG-928-D20]